jgi:hypothetical protein
MGGRTCPFCQVLLTPGELHRRRCDCCGGVWPESIPAAAGPPAEALGSDTATPRPLTNPFTAVRYRL